MTARNASLRGELGHAGGEGLAHGLAHGVAPVGVVEGERGDVAVALEKQQGLGHGGSLPEPSSGSKWRRRPREAAGASGSVGGARAGRSERRARLRTARRSRPIGSPRHRGRGAAAPSGRATPPGPARRCARAAGAGEELIIGAGSGRRRMTFAGGVRRGVVAPAAADPLVVEAGGDHRHPHLALVHARRRSPRRR